MVLARPLFEVLQRRRRLLAALPPPRTYVGLLVGAVGHPGAVAVSQSRLKVTKGLLVLGLEVREHAVIQVVKGGLGTTPRGLGNVVEDRPDRAAGGSKLGKFLCMWSKGRGKSGV